VPALLVLGWPTWLARPGRSRAIQPQRADRVGIRAAIGLPLWAIGYMTGMSADGATPSAARVVSSIAERQLAASFLP
jgi:hypothetical protein